MVFSSVLLTFSQKYLHHSVPCVVVYQIKEDYFEFQFNQKSFKTPLSNIYDLLGVPKCAS